MHSQPFDPSPLLHVMADEILKDYGASTGVKIAERAIARVRHHPDGEMLAIWLGLHQLLAAAAEECPAAALIH